MSRRWVAGVIILIVVIGAMLYFNQAPDTPGGAAISPAATVPSEPTPKP